MKNIYIVDTPYHLLISIVKTLLARREGMDTLLIMKNVIPLNFQKNARSVFCDIVNSYNRYNILLYIFLFKLQQSNIPIFSKFAKKIKIKLLDIFSNDSDIYIFDDTFYYGCWLNNTQTKYNLIEDALNYYRFPKKKTPLMKRYDYLYKIMGVSWNYWGKSKYTKSIEVNDDKKLCIKHNNIIVRNREKMFKQLSPKQIDIIAQIFNYEPLNNVFPGDKTLLLTQPLEDGLMSREKKIKIYKYLVEKYGVGTLYIKVHPREKEDYSKIFPNAVILGNAKIPFEVYQLKEDFHFKKAITTFSAAMDAVFCADEKIIFGRENTLNFRG